MEDLAGQARPKNKASLSNPILCLLQEGHLLPKLGAHPLLQDLPLLRVPPQPQVCLLQGYLLQVMDQGVPHLLHPLSLQHRAPAVGVPVPQAWLLPLLEPNSGK